MSQVKKRTLYDYQTEEERDLAKHIAQTLYQYDHTVQERMATVDDITEEHIEKFWQQGYLVLDQVLDGEEVQTSIDALMDILFERSTGPKIQFVRPKEELKTDEERELAVRKISHYVQHEPRLYEVAHHEKIIRALTKLYDEKPKMVQDQAILKPPTGGTEKPWHQDMAYAPLTFERPVIGAWIALDKAELDNGCMHIIPRSHMDGPTPHYAERDWQICDTNVPVHRDVAVPLEPGGVLLFHGMLYHGTPPNFSTKRRRALQFHYAPQSATKMTPKEYKRWFTNEMTNAEC